MVNFNGNLVTNTSLCLEKNRGFLYGDAVFETIKTLDNKILFLEDHYFRLMASMRILRMEIPMNFTLEFLEEEIQKTISAQNEFSSSYRVRITCYREGEGKYLPKTRNISYLITVEKANSVLFELNDGKYEIELYKDFYVTKHLLSTLKTTNKLVNITGAIFAEENDYENVLLINEEKNIVEALHGNIYVINKNQICTPPVSDGCVNGIMRKKIKALAEKWDEMEWVERSISPFELQKADEIWISNVMIGLNSVSKYRKKNFDNALAKQMINRLNAAIRFD